MAIPETRVQSLCRQPSPALRGLVLGYHGHRLELDRPRVRLEVPSGTVCIILGFEHQISLRAASGPEPSAFSHGSLVAGMRTTAAISRHSGRLHGVSITLSPLGAYRILGLPMHEIADTFVGFEDVAGPDGARLVEQLRATRRWPDRFARLDRYFIRRLAFGPAASEQVAGALHLLAANPNAPLDEIAREVGWGGRHLRARFQEQVGLPPKSVARVNRLHTALSRQLLGYSWAEVAVQCGYHDQPHLVHDFTAMTGRTPTEFARLRAGLQPGSPIDRVPGRVTSIQLAG